MMETIKIELTVDELNNVISNLGVLKNICEDEEEGMTWTREDEEILNKLTQLICWGERWLTSVDNVQYGKQ